MPHVKPVLVSGVKPTGDAHIGNYFGAMRQFVELVNSGKYDSYIFIADYHALNSIQNADQMRHLTYDLLAAYLAIGLNPKKVALFKQSELQAHTELAWIFDTVTTMPYLMRAHAFKASIQRAKQTHEQEKKNISHAVLNRFKEGTQHDDNAQLDIAFEQVLRSMSDIGVGTFNYPVLMAADILLYDAAIVPVGQDQKQHIEYARDIAEKFNKTFIQTFTLPEAHIMSDVASVPGIDGKKMSKSYKNVIPLFASRSEIEKLVSKIVTDTDTFSVEDEDSLRPYNLYAIHKLLKNELELKALYRVNAHNYSKLKSILIDDLDAFIKPMRDKYKKIRSNQAHMESILKRGANKARKRAEAKISAVRKAVGVR